MCSATPSGCSPTTRHSPPEQPLGSGSGRRWCRLGPAATARLRRGELLARLVGDGDTQQDLPIRVAVPTASVTAVGVATTVGMAILLRKIQPLGCLSRDHMCRYRHGNPDEGGGLSG